jgi:hypothetical protein
MYKYSTKKYTAFYKDKVKTASMSYQETSCSTGTSIEVMLVVTPMFSVLSSSPFNIKLSELTNNYILQTYSIAGM